MGNNLCRPSPPPLILSLPDGILLEILSRVSLDALPSIPFVCCRFSNLVKVPNSLTPHLIPTLHVLLFSEHSFLLFASLPLSSNSTNWSPSTRRQLSEPQPKPRLLLSLGRSIYILRHQSALRYDTWTKTVKTVIPPTTLDSRKNFAAAAVNGRIYCFSTPAPAPVEEYDPKVDKWHVLTHAPASCNGSIAVGAGGVLYILTSNPAGLMHAYDVSKGEWMMGGMMPTQLPGRGSVVGACGTPAGHVYIIVCYGIELSFWRWEGRGEEWRRLEEPVVPERKGLVCKAVRIGCVAAGDDRVVAIVSVSPDGTCGWITRDVLVYNVVDGMWSRGPQLPIEFYSQPDLAFTQY